MQEPADAGGERCAALRDEMIHARALVESAATVLLTAQRDVTVQVKPDGSLLTDIDLRVAADIAASLQSRFPGDAVLSEEALTADAVQAVAGDGRTWCLDPVDGTGNLAAGLPFACVSLALIRDGEVELGVVCDPYRGECFSALRGGGAWLNGTPLTLPPRRTPELAMATAIVDLKRLAPGLATRIATGAPYRSQRCFGASALELCWLAADRAQLFLDGGQCLWDRAAGALILEEAGGAVQSLAPQPGTAAAMAGPVPVAAATHPALLAEWLAWIRAAAA
jgi:myo-inositol-1(or 4)-monophosphatase